MPKFNPIRNIPEAHNFGPNDTLVVFGELFQRGYANGVVDEAVPAERKATSMQRGGVFNGIGRGGRYGGGEQ